MQQFCFHFPLLTICFDFRLAYIFSAEAQNTRQDIFLRFPALDGERSKQPKEKRERAPLPPLTHPPKKPGPKTHFLVPSLKQECLDSEREGGGGRKASRTSPNPNPTSEKRKIIDVSKDWLILLLLKLRFSTFGEEKLEPRKQFANFPTQDCDETKSITVLPLPPEKKT